MEGDANPTTRTIYTSSAGRQHSLEVRSLKHHNLAGKKVGIHVNAQQIRILSAYFRCLKRQSYRLLDATERELLKRCQQLGPKIRTPGESSVEQDIVRATPPSLQHPNIKLTRNDAKGPGGGGGRQMTPLKYYVTDCGSLICFFFVVVILLSTGRKAPKCGPAWYLYQGLMSGVTASAGRSGRQCPATLNGAIRHKTQHICTNVL